MSARPRRGWRERVEDGLYRVHKTGCPSSIDQQPGRRCRCPFVIAVPGALPRSTRMVTIPGSITEARSERRRLLAAGRPEPEPESAYGTLHELATAVFRTRAPSLAPSTMKTHGEGWQLRVRPKLGDLSLEDVTRERVERWWAATLASSSHHAARKALRALSFVLRHGEEWGVCSNVSRRPKLPKVVVGAEDSRAARALAQDDLERLFAASTTVRNECILRLAGETGLRLGEVIGLHFDDLDLPARRITVRRSVWQRAGRLQEDGSRGRPDRIAKAPKSGRSRRVAISAALATALSAWYEEAVLTLGHAAAGPVFPGRKGGYSDTSPFPQMLTRTLERAGLMLKSADGDEIPPITFHGLRHSAASAMLLAGVPLLVVSRQLGHADPAITARVYAHLTADSQLDRAMDAFEPPDDPATVGEPVEEGRESL